MIAMVIEIFEVFEEFKVPWGFGVGMLVPLMRGSRKMERWQNTTTTIKNKMIKFATNF